jgi:excisionase family DNA binding protein
MELVTIDEVCKMLSCCRRTLEYAVARGDITAPKRIGKMRRRYWLAKDIDRLLKREIAGRGRKAKS